MGVLQVKGKVIFIYEGWQEIILTKMRHMKGGEV
jgi:hypothetical protein